MGSVAKVFVTDIDGTLLGADGDVHPSDAEAIAALIARGVPVALCTGRMYSGTRDIAESLSILGPVACIDGSHIVDSTNHLELHSTPLSDVATELLFEALGRIRPAAFAFSGDRLFHDAHGAQYLDYVSTWTERTQQVDLLTDFDAWREPDASLSALVALGTPDQIRSAESFIKTNDKHLQCVMFEVGRPGYSGTWGLVVRASGVDKGTAIDWVARHHGVSAAEVVAVGDWLNDIPMLRRAGRSFAMAQAPAAVKAAATDVLKANHTSGGGLAEAAMRAGLL
jgi:Cof subfamily protein (haloacid dehalogenase superfamily)